MTNLSTADLRRVQMSLLNSFDVFCRENDLRYYMAFGTLLGAVRHSGYIPWDDDVDLMMLRPDYERLIEIYPRAVSPTEPTLGASSSHAGWPYPYAKLWDPDTLFEEDSDVAIPIGVNIDIFPVDGCAESALAKRLQRLQLRAFKAMLLLKSVKPRSDHPWHRVALLRTAKFVLVGAPTSRIVESLNRCATRYTPHSSRRVGVRVGSFDWSIPRESLGDPRKITFEGASYPAPRDTESVLAVIYGDFMQLPPESQRKSHHRFRARWANRA